MACEMHTSLRHTMRLARWIGVFPVSGLNQPTIAALRWDVVSIYFLFSLIVLFSQIVVAFLCVHHLIYHFHVSDITLLVFCVTTALTVLFLMKLARNWPMLMRNAKKIEQSLPAVRTKMNPLKFVAVTYFSMCLAAVNHVLSVNFKLTNIKNCQGKSNIDYEIFEQYLTANFSYLFSFASPAPWKIILYEISDIQATFVWNFNDIVTMCASMYLSSHFRDLNSYIMANMSRKPNWAQIRLHYSLLVRLVKAVDSQLCYMILLSFFTNVFFICNQLFHATNRFYTLADSSCKPEAIKLTANSYAHLIYYVYSFTFLLFRFFLTSCLAVRVNTEALKPIRALRDVPSEDYDEEVQRFARQLRHSVAALSGYLFYVTKGMILSAISTIVTYEIVLLQFKQKIPIPWMDTYNHTSYIQNVHNK